MPEMRRRGLGAGVTGAFLSGVGGILVGYYNQRHDFCQTPFVELTKQCQVPNDAWTAGLVLLVVGAVFIVIAIVLAITTEPQPVVPWRPTLNTWICIAVIVAMLVAVLVVTVQLFVG